MSSSSDTSSLEKLRAELKQLKTEHKALQAENPKRLKAQIKRLQDDNRGKQAEINLLKNRVKQVQSESQGKDAILQDMEHNLGSLKVLEKPHWESEDKTWAVYLEPDRDTKEGEQLDFHLRLVDRKTGGAKMPHMENDDDGKTKLSWPRMRAIPKDVKAVIEGIVEI